MKACMFVFRGNHKLRFSPAAYQVRRARFCL